MTPKDLRCGHGIHEGLMNARYGKKMRFAIMFEAQMLWAATNPHDMVENLMPFWLENYFLQENYLVIDNKPVLFVYDYQHQLENSFSSPDEQRRTFDVCREMARAAGFDGMLFAIEYRFDDLVRIKSFLDYGYDFYFAYCWPVERPHPSNELVMSEQMNCIRRGLENFPDAFVPTASVMWDPTPRLRKKSAGLANPTQEEEMVWKLQPKSFRDLLVQIRAELDSIPANSLANRLLMIDNWNEWDAEHYVSTSLEFGFQYLQAIREELTDRDNLPDYRLPQELGFCVNKHWDTPEYAK